MNTRSSVPAETLCVPPLVKRSGAKRVWKAASLYHSSFWCVLGMMLIAFMCANVIIEHTAASLDPNKQDNRRYF